jgi:TatA/E family protein of Tat protein translocase
MPGADSGVRKTLPRLTIVEHKNRRLLAIRSGSIMDSMNLGFPEMIFLFLFALILFGPKKLPEIGRQIGRALNEFKRASNEFKSQIESEIAQLDLENSRQTILPPVQAPAGSVASGSLPPVEASLPENSAPEIPEPQMTSLAKAPDA